MAHITLLGNAVVDGFCKVTEQTLKDHKIPKADCVHFSHEQFMALNEDVVIEHFASGGSAANVAWTLGMLGHTVNFIGKLGNDPAGNHFYHSMQQAGVHMATPSDKSRTFQIFVLVTPDGQRTFVEPTNATLLTPDAVDRGALTTSEWLVVEGYTVLDQFETVVYAISQARKAGCRVILTLPPSQILHRASQEFAQLIISGVDMVFSDTKEAETMTELLPDAALAVWHNTNRVQTMSAEGATYYCAHHPAQFVPTTPVKTPVDLTGVGDTFVAGFLHQMLEGRSVHDSLSFGNFLAGHVLHTFGARLSPAFFQNDTNTLQQKA